jgi:hypothetical protein
VGHGHACPAAREPRDHIENILSGDLSAYHAAILSTKNLVPLVEASGRRCGKCKTSRCARPHAVRFRKLITDLATGEVFRNLPIRRVLFCDGTTGSLFPAEVWRGRFTISSVIEAVARVHRDGVEATAEWALYGSTGEEPVSERTLRRWPELVRTRLVGSAFSWLGPQLDLSWSDQAPVAAQLDRLLDRVTGPLLAGFRALTGRALLDKPSAHPPSPARSPARRVPGRLAPALPPITPSPTRRRGAWSRLRRREAPRRDPEEVEPP